MYLKFYIISYLFEDHIVGAKTRFIALIEEINQAVNISAPANFLLSTRLPIFWFEKKNLYYTLCNNHLSSKLKSLIFILECKRSKISLYACGMIIHIMSSELAQIYSLIIIIFLLSTYMAVVSLNITWSSCYHWPLLSYLYSL
jgi:hypothetical protein